MKNAKIPLGRKGAAWLAGTWAMKRGRRLFGENQVDWNRPLSKADKVLVGAYLILRDYGDGSFPARLQNREEVFQRERDYAQSIPGVKASEFLQSQVRKPFWDGASFERYAVDFARVLKGMRRFGIVPPATVLELGCGIGWMSEWLACAGYHTCGVTISEAEAALARKRVDALRNKGFSEQLRFVTGAMEEADRLGLDTRFDTAVIYEALHHAFDWRDAIRAASACVKQGGWLFICREPNLIHTFTSYRVGRLSNTHEIGMSRREICRALVAAGFDRVELLCPRLHFYARSHWLAAQRS